MNVLQKFFITILLGSFLIACNDDKGGDLFNGDGGVDVGAADFRMGSGTPFVEGQVELGFDQISSGGTTSVSVDIVDDQGSPYMEPVEVNFTSACAKELTAQLTPSVMTNNGHATSTYTANGCVNNDVITITASVGGLNLIAEATINVLSGGTADFRMGSGTPFIEGQVELGLGQISSGGTTSVSIDIVDDQDSPYMEPVEVNFTSACAEELTAQLTPSVMTNNGQATSDYTANGCVNNDVITITASVGGLNLIAEATINILSADVNSIQFVKAEPEYIGIIGTGAVGGSENSTLTFRVVDVNDQPVSNTEVSFSLNTVIGGLSLNQYSAITDDQGFVTTVVHGGTVATTVRVTAQITGILPLIATQSSLLIVSTGIPDQDSFSLSADKYNVEGWDYDGTEVTVMARLSDAYNNPVPDGTAVTFRTEGGQIKSGCFTENGGCTALWTSQVPRPIDGRVTVTATAIGEESFFDSNGNGRFDVEEFPSFDAKFDISEDFFEDYNEDGKYIWGEDKLIDFNSNGIFDGVDHKYNGVLCALDSKGNNANQYCADGSESQPQSAKIRSNLVLIMSGSNPVLKLLGVNDSNGLHDANVPIDDDYDPYAVTVVINGKGLGSVKLEISDENYQQMPAGTKVDFSVSVGSLAAGGSNVWPSSNNDAGKSFDVVIQGADKPDIGMLTVTIETPHGDITEIILATIEIL